MKTQPKRKFLLCLLGLLVIPLLIFVSCAAPVEEEEEEEVVTVEPIKLALISPLEFIAGKHHRMSAILAVEEINEAGGVNVAGVMRPIELVIRDSNELKSIPDAVSAVEWAITVEKVDFVMGGHRSEAVFAMSDVAMDYKKLYLTAGAASKVLGQRVADDYDRYKYFFRLNYPHGEFMGPIGAYCTEMVANVMKEKLGVEPKIAIVMGKTLWADPQVIQANEHFLDMGFEVVGIWRPSSVATDVTAELTAINAAGANIIHITFTGPVGIPFARQRAELGLPVAVSGYNEEAGSTEYWEITEGAADYEGPYFNTVSPNADITPTSKHFWKAFYDRWGVQPMIISSCYHQVYILKDAIEKVGAIDQDALVKTLEETDYPAPQGRIVLDSHHDVIWGAGYYTFVGNQWRDGEYRTVWPPADGSWRGVVYPGIIDYEFSPVLLEALGK
ncbi:Leucine-, isoleucine-, valine-, threonine-, and alanine-binding protein [subsurface metagenome]